MANENERITDIVREMRYRVEANEGAGIHPGNCRLYTQWADRVESAHKREVAELKSKINDVVCENEALRDACGTCSAKREVAELKNKCEEYERQPELMAETAKAALELLKAQESKITELRACLAGALEVVDSTVVNLGIAERARSHEDYKRWRKALEGAKDEENNS